jgi:hypothetical protein
MKPTCARFLILLGSIVALTTTKAQAQLNAVTLAGPVYSAGGGTNVYGWSFTAETNLKMLSVGLYDFVNGDGFEASHQVGLWDTTQPSQALLTTTIPSGTVAPLVDGFRYVPISPLVLKGGHEYVIAASYHSDDDVLGTVNNPLLSITAGPGISLGNYRFGTDASQLSFPENFEPGPNPMDGPFSGIGPDFTYTLSFTPVPEASTALACGLGVLAIVARTVRRQTLRKHPVS